MVTAGVTGGIGSGKTTVCTVWEQLGARVVNSDEIARKLMVNDPDLKGEILAAFGENAYHSDGTLNRRFLSEEAFQSGRVEELNRLVHPRVRDEVLRLMDEARSLGYPMFVQEAALLLKYGRPDHVEIIVLVKADRKSRISRVMARDNLPEEDRVTERMESQVPDRELEPLCDLVIENSSGLPELKRKAALIFSELTGIEAGNQI